MQQAGSGRSTTTYHRFSGHRPHATEDKAAWAPGGGEGKGVLPTILLGTFVPSRGVWSRRCASDEDTRRFLGFAIPTCSGVFPTTLSLFFFRAPQAYTAQSPVQAHTPADPYATPARPPASPLSLLGSGAAYHQHASGHALPLTPDVGAGTHYPEAFAGCPTPAPFPHPKRCAAPSSEVSKPFWPPGPDFSLTHPFLSKPLELAYKQRL